MALELLLTTTFSSKIITKMQCLHPILIHIYYVIFQLVEILKNKELVITI